MTEPIHITISGAAGRLGYSLIFRIAAGGLFDRTQPVALHLLDVPDMLPLLEADCRELRDCAFPLLADVSIHTDPVQAFAGTDWCILLAGRPLGTSVSKRIDLIRQNAPIYIEHGRAINEACPYARILVVGNPCNTNCLIAMNHAPNVPKEHWFAMNRMDRMRATSLIAEKAGVPVNEVNRVTVWGNHSESLYVDFHNAFIGDRPVGEVIEDTEWPWKVLQPSVANRSREIVELRGCSPAGTAAQAILGTIRSLTRPTPYNRYFGAAVITDGRDYDIPPGLVFGVPLRSEDGQSWSIVRGLYLDDHAQERLAVNVAELEHEATVASEIVHSLK